MHYWAREPGTRPRGVEMSAEYTISRRRGGDGVGGKTKDVVNAGDLVDEMERTR